MFGDRSIVYTWSQSWNLWDDAAIIPVYSQMRGWANIVDGVLGGIDELIGTVDKTKRMGYENLNRTPGAIICRGLAQVLWIPVILRATYKIGGFVYYSIMSPSVGFKPYKHVESKNEHYLVGKKHLENKQYQHAVDAFTKGLEAGDTDSVYMRCWIYCEEMIYDDKIPELEIKTLLEKISPTDIRAEFLYQNNFISDLDQKRDIYLTLAKQGYVPAIGRLVNFERARIEEYVQKGSIALEKEDPESAAQFYVCLALVFDKIGNPIAQKRLLEKAAALCTIDTIVTIASRYRVTNPLAYDPFLATIDSYDNGDEASAKRFHDIGSKCADKNNLDLAEKYYLKAANLGYAYSMICLASVLSGKTDLSEIETKQNNTEILNWLHKAADLKDSQAYKELGDAYKAGLYRLEKNIHTAIAYYEKGTDETHDVKDYIFINMRTLGEINENGADGIPIDLNKDLEWYRKENAFRIKVKIIDDDLLTEKIKELQRLVGI
jgi:TPR repeat protein